MTSGKTLSLIYSIPFLFNSIHDKQYGNKGCRVFKRGVQNQKYFCIKTFEIINARKAFRCIKAL